MRTTERTVYYNLFDEDYVQAAIMLSERLHQAPLFQIECFIKGEAGRVAWFAVLCTMRRWRLIESLACELREFRISQASDCVGDPASSQSACD